MRGGRVEVTGLVFLRKAGRAAEGGTCWGRGCPTSPFSLVLSPCPPPPAPGRWSPLFGVSYPLVPYSLFNPTLPRRSPSPALIHSWPPQSLFLFDSWEENFLWALSASRTLLNDVNFFLFEDEYSVKKHLLSTCCI